VSPQGRDFYALIERLSPQSDDQRRLQTQMLGIGIDLGRLRLLLFEERERSMPMPFLVMLVFWLTIIFVSFGLFAPPNGTVVTTMFVCALSVSGAIYLILELARPFGGLLQISSAPLRDALQNLGRQVSIAGGFRDDEKHRGELPGASEFALRGFRAVAARRACRCGRVGGGAPARPRSAAASLGRRHLALRDGHARSGHGGRRTRGIGS
jgi:hypothetical protein